MRERFNLKCKVCNCQNYINSRNKTKHPDKMVTNKYCSKCRKKTEHVETK